SSSSSSGRTFSWISRTVISTFELEPSARGNAICFVSPADAPTSAASHAAGGRAERRLELGGDPATSQLHDRVRLRLAVGVHEVDDQRVARLRGALAPPRQLRDGPAEHLALRIAGLLGHLDLRARHFELRPLDELRQGLDVDGCDE